MVSYDCLFVELVAAPLMDSRFAPGLSIIISIEMVILGSRLDCGDNSERLCCF